MTSAPRGSSETGTALVVDAPAASVATRIDTHELLPKLRAFAARVLRAPVDHPDVEDCAQEALSRCLAQPADPTRGPGFVFGVARHVALDHLRRQSRRRETFAGAPDSQSDLGRIASDGPSPEDLREREQRHAELLRALQALPENHRMVLQMFYLEQNSYETIAERMGVPMGTVATWMARGKSRLAEQVRRSGA